MLITSYKKEKEKGNAAAGICWEGHNEIWTSSTRKKQKHVNAMYLHTCI